MLIVGIAGAVLAQQGLREKSAPAGRSTGRTGEALPAPSTTAAQGKAETKRGFGDEAALRKAIRSRTSDTLVRFESRVRKILPDDRDGDRHQRFLVELKSGETLLIAHNIDLAPRVPAEVGDVVTIAGEYEWNEQGGVVHWTHHDPGKRRQDGSIEHKGKAYK